ncbi:MAG TPA: TIGR03986 family CRISPR-associated RAMP protein [Mycobacteriales bacterium]|nr:TIGR03986 family CRISPR-associated RAMP protein [Mycobacteriales bacterium]
MVDFINPYAFVPFADTPVRDEPNGHSALCADNLSGVLTVTLRARTPLLLGGYGESGTQIPRRADGSMMIPGSGLLGAVRSVHEAMAGGCLRVIDQHFTPVHRDPANSEVTKDLRLAMVLQVDADGRPETVSLCADVVWIEKDLLAAKPGGSSPATGDRLHYAGKPVPSVNRMVLTEGEVTLTSGLSPYEDGSWVLLVTDTRARNKDMPAYFVAGRPGDDIATVGDAVWESYLRRVDGTEDMREFRKARKAANDPRGSQAKIGDEPPEDQFADVLWPPPSDDTPASSSSVIACRLRIRPYLRPGQPVWVKVSGTGLDLEVTEIRPSCLWRFEGDYAVAKRIGAAGPCTDPTTLCWSCRIFGSADVGGQHEAVSVQNAYRGHVRVDDAVADGEPATRTWELAPLATPKPSAGQFYLHHSDRGVTMANKDERPAARWGSATDTTGHPRRIKGRKFYWRTTDPTGGNHPRGRKRGHHSSEMTRAAQLIEKDATFVARVAFDNLSLADLGSLVAALDPRRLWSASEENRDYVISVGGGKPFGFGAVTVTVGLDLVDSARSRYLGETRDGPVAEELLDDAVLEFRSAVPFGVRNRWPGLQHLLTLGYVPDELVWYPPGDGAKGEPKYDRGFDFWQKSSGIEMSKEDRPLTGLPDPAGPPEKQVMTTNVARRRETGS